jgi:hypothetical protein
MSPSRLTFAALAAPRSVVDATVVAILLARLLVCFLLGYCTVKVRSARHYSVSAGGLEVGVTPFLFAPSLSAVEALFSTRFQMQAAIGHASGEKHDLNLHCCLTGR